LEGRKNHGKSHYLMNEALPDAANRPQDTRPADSARNWVDRYAPAAARPYLRLARADRPVGSWLLLWPCWWSLALAATQTESPWPDWRLLVLFAVGAVVMRGAGCTLNDIFDREFDAKVERTRGRPLPSGAITVARALLFMITLGLCGMVILLQFNGFAIWVGLASIPLIVTYPLMKRVTYWPQLFLGATFNWGALLGWAAVTGELSAAPVALYLAGIFWTLGYDTIYAHQDKEDDALVGVKSSALRLGDRTRPWLWGFYGCAAVVFGICGALAGLSWPFYLSIVAIAAQFGWQAAKVDISNGQDCLAKFKSNARIGWVLFAGIVMGAVV